MKNLDRMKFRVWDIKNKILLDNQNSREVSEKYKLSSSIYDFEEYWMPCIEEVFRLESFMKLYGTDFIIMQSIGLKDKNGKLIFEGDIVNHEAFIDEVVFKNGVFSTKRNKDNQPLYFHENTKENKHAICDLLKSIEIVGNIYENKNLID